LNNDKRAKSGKSQLRTLFRKGTVDVILYLATAEKARYSDIKKRQYVIGDRSLSRILKELQKRELIRREVLPTYPVSATYALTDKGKLVSEHLNILKEAL